MTTAVTPPTTGAMFDPSKFLAEKTLKSLVRQQLTDAGHDMTKYSKGNAPHEHEAQCEACKGIVAINVANNEARFTIVTGHGITADDVHVMRRADNFAISCEAVQRMKAKAALPAIVPDAVSEEAQGEDEVAAQNRAAGFVPPTSSSVVHRQRLGRNLRAGATLAALAMVSGQLAHAADFTDPAEQRPTSMKDVLIDALREAGNWTYQLRSVASEHHQEITLFDKSGARQFQQVERGESDAIVAALEFLTNRDAKPSMVLETSPSSAELRIASEMSQADVQARVEHFIDASPLAPPRRPRQPVRFELTPERKELADTRIQEVLRRPLPARKNSLAGKIQGAFGNRAKLLEQAGKNSWRQQPLAPGGDKNCRACHGVAVPCRNHRGRRPVA